MNNSKEIARKAIARSNKPLNKYNEAIHMETEELTGEANDRVAADAGNDPLEFDQKGDCECGACESHL